MAESKDKSEWDRAALICLIMASSWSKGKHDIGEYHPYLKSKMKSSSSIKANSQNWKDFVNVICKG